MPSFDFEALSAKNKRIYLASDRVREIVLPAVALPSLATKVRRLRGALGAAELRSVEQASREIVRALCEALTVSIPLVRVLEVRPHGDYGELHGLYTRWRDGRARVEVWMRTARNEQPVAFRTFLRTLGHELVHHLDYAHLALGNSFHTEGFFARESSLVKQLLAAVPQAEPTRRTPAPGPPSDETRADKLARLRAQLSRGGGRRARSRAATATETAESARAPLEAESRGPEESLLALAFDARERASR